MSTKSTIRLGTRGSKLALAQAEIVKKKFESLFPDLSFEIKVIHTLGDKDLKSPLYEIGGKGVFIKELELGLKEQEVDIAVHSLKDITSQLLPELQLSAFLKAEAVTDVIILKKECAHFEDIPKGATLATGSLRRKALLKKLRPDIKTTDIRGNVQTRLAKLESGNIDGILLSEAGLIRLGMEEIISYRFNPYIFCPAPGQGVIALETRKADKHITELCEKINSKEQMIKSTTELAFLGKVGFDCRIPLGLYATLDNEDTITFNAFLANSNLDRFLEQRVKFSVKDRIRSSEALSEEFIKWREKNDH